MIPILFAPSATSFTSQGIGTLSDAVTCEVHEAINGEFELEMTYPTTGCHYDDIEVYSIILVQLPYLTDKQAFRVYKISTVLCGLTTVYARHLSYDLNYNTDVDYNGGISYATAKLALQYIDNCVLGAWSISTALTTSGVWMPTGTLSTRTIFSDEEGCILSTYGGEWLWDNYNCTLVAQRGSDQGYHIRYGKNLKSLKSNTAGEDALTNLHMIWYGKYDSTSTSSWWHFYRQTPLYGVLPIQKYGFVDITDTFDSYPSSSELDTFASEYCTAKGWNTEAPPSIELDFLALSQLGTDLALGDTVHVDLEDGSLSLRAVEITWDVLLEQYTDVKLGSVENTLADTICNLTTDVAGLSAGQSLVTFWKQVTVTLSNNSSIPIITDDEIAAMTGWPASGSDDVCIVASNVSGATAHLDGTTYVASANKWYANWDRTWSGTATINFLVIRIKK